MKKLYYSISEVAAMTGVAQSALRFWETEFKHLSPKRNAGGTRFYTQQDIDTVKQIILLKKQNLNLNGVEQHLSDNKDAIARKQEVVERLRDIKKELQGIARFL